ncbi:MAG TPA: ATP-binding protein, partial [Spirochaetota bacterium]|nr:ATP-binding protein [Spirochaetota bacterium]
VSFLNIHKHEKRGKLSGVGLVKKDGSIVLCDINVAVVFNRSGLPVKMVGSISDVTSRKMNEDILQNAHREIEDILLSMNTIIIGVSLQDKVTHWNREAELALHVKAKEAIGSQVTMLRINWDWERIYEGIARTMLDDCSINLQEVRYATESDAERSRFLNIKITPIRDFGGEVKGFILSGDDITENRAMRIRSNQSQKLESIGQLASGIAHEINTPTQYINDNTMFLKKAFEKIVPYIRFPEDADSKDARDIRFYLEEIPKAIDQSIEGIGKISAIVGSVKQFSHPGTQKKIPYDVLKIVNDVVTITRNEWKYVSDVDVTASGNIPLISCHPNVISQVLVNMIVNSAQSIAEKFGTVTDKQGKIGIAVSSLSDYIEIKVSDNGKGIPDSIKDRIFDPFFTTKDVGKGTGQGLAIAYSAITTMHGGTIMVDSNVNEGTVFTIRLPFKDDSEQSDDENFATE